MIEFKLDRRVFYGLMTVLGVGLALGLGLLLGRIMGGGQEAADTPAAAPEMAQPPADAGGQPGAITLNPDDPEGAVEMIQGGGQTAPDAAAPGQPAPSIDYAALGINADGELTPEQDATVQRISQADAEQKLEDPNVVFVDVRSDLEFEQGHIPGSRNIVAYQADDQLSTLPKDQEIILYCA